MSADYSQIELRVLAHMSGDEKLREAFIEDRDIHTQTAMNVFGVAPDEVDAGNAPPGESGQFRHRVRHKRIRPVAKPEHSAKSGQPSSSNILKRSRFGSSWTTRWKRPGGKDLSRRS